MKHLIGLVGTNSDKSTNRQLLQFIKNNFAEEATVELLEINDFPMFNKPEDKTLPPIIQAYADKIEQADGVIISTPEYNHSVPASLINALNWLSYNIYPFVDKPVMITGASYGTLGSSRAQAQLRQILDSPELKARIMPSSEFLLSHSLQAFDDDNNLKDPLLIEKLTGLLADFLIFTDLVNQLVHAHDSNKKAAENFSWENL